MLKMQIAGLNDKIFQGFESLYIACNKIHSLYEQEFNRNATCKTGVRIIIKTS